MCVELATDPVPAVDDAALCVDDADVGSAEGAVEGSGIPNSAQQLSVEKKSAMEVVFEEAKLSLSQFIIA